MARGGKEIRKLSRGRYSGSAARGPGAEADEWSAFSWDLGGEPPVRKKNNRLNQEAKRAADSDS